MRYKVHLLHSTLLARLKRYSILNTLSIGIIGHKGYATREDTVFETQLHVHKTNKCPSFQTKFQILSIPIFQAVKYSLIQLNI